MNVKNMITAASALAGSLGIPPRAGESQNRQVVSDKPRLFAGTVGSRRLNRRRYRPLPGWARRAIEERRRAGDPDDRHVKRSSDMMHRAKFQPAPFPIGMHPRDLP